MRVLYFRFSLFILLFLVSLFFITDCSCSEYAIRKIQENQVELKLNRTQQLLIYADDVTLLGDNTDTIKKNTKLKTKLRGF
jgi:hypothetical protein